jgi:hypothetical protein
MLLEIFILLELIMIGFFITSFFTQHEILWSISVLLSGVLMITSFNVQIKMLVFDSTLGASVHQLVSYDLGHMLAFNLLFFGLGLILFIMDIFDKYGFTTSKMKEKIFFKK